MKKYQLVVFKFTYVSELVCLWPTYFEVDIHNSFGERAQDILQRAINELETYPGITGVAIIHNKIADIEECKETLEQILFSHSDAKDIAIKYLELESQIQLVNEPRFDYTTLSYYIPIQVHHFRFPVRVRAKNFKFMLDDLELPLLLIGERK